MHPQNKEPVRVVQPGADVIISATQFLHFLNNLVQIIEQTSLEQREAHPDMREYLYNHFIQKEVFEPAWNEKYLRFLIILLTESNLETIKMLRNQMEAELQKKNQKEVKIFQQWLVQAIRNRADYDYSFQTGMGESDILVSQQIQKKNQNYFKEIRHKQKQFQAEIYDKNLSLFYGEKYGNRGHDFLRNLKHTYFLQNLLKIYHPLVNIVFTEIPPEMKTWIQINGSLTLKKHIGFFPYVTIGKEHLDIIKQFLLNDANKNQTENKDVFELYPYFFMRNSAVPSDRNRQALDIINNHSKYFKNQIHEFYVARITKGGEKFNLKANIEKAFSQAVKNTFFISFQDAMTNLFSFEQRIYLNTFELETSQALYERQVSVAYLVLKLISLIADYVINCVKGWQFYNPKKTFKQVIRSAAQGNSQGHAFEEFITDRVGFEFATMKDYQILKSPKIEFKQLGLERKGQQRIKCLNQKQFHRIPNINNFQQQQRLRILRVNEEQMNEENILKKYSKIANDEQVKEVNSPRVQLRTDQNAYFSQILTNLEINKVLYKKENVKLEEQINTQIISILKELQPYLIQQLQKFYQNNFGLNLNQNISSLIYCYTTIGLEKIKYYKLPLLVVRGYVFNGIIKVNLELLQQDPSAKCKQTIVSYCVLTIFRLLASYALSKILKISDKDKDQYIALKRYLFRKDLGYKFEVSVIDKQQIKCASYIDYLKLKNGIFLFKQLGNHGGLKHHKCIQFQTKDKISQYLSQFRLRSSATFAEPNLNLDLDLFPQTSYDLPNHIFAQIKEIFQKDQKLLSYYLQTFYVKKIKENSKLYAVQGIIPQLIGNGLQNIKFMHIPVPIRGYVYQNTIKLNLYQLGNFLQAPDKRAIVVSYCVLSLMRLLASYTFQNLLENSHDGESQKEACLRFLLRVDLGFRFQFRASEAQRFICASETDYKVLKSEGLIWQKLGKHRDHEQCVKFQTFNDINEWIIEYTRNSTNRQRIGLNGHTIVEVQEPQLAQKRGRTVSYPIELIDSGELSKRLTTGNLRNLTKKIISPKQSQSMKSQEKQKGVEQGCMSKDNDMDKL